MTSLPEEVGLLDVNVLVALAWPNHEAHQAVRSWFSANGASGWVTTPVTESGFVRVSANRRAMPTSTTPVLARQLLASLCELPGHVFWPDDIRLVTGAHLDLSRLTGHRQVTDAHLLALCHQHRGRVVTLDAGLRDLSGGTVPVELIRARTA